MVRVLFEGRCYLRASTINFNMLQRAATVLIHVDVSACVIGEELFVILEENSIHDHHAISMMKLSVMFPMRYPEHSTTY